MSPTPDNSDLYVRFANTLGPADPRLCTEHFTSPYNLCFVIGMGSAGCVEWLPCGHVRKRPRVPYVPSANDARMRDWEMKQLAREFEVYQRLGPQRHILSVVEYSSEAGMLVLPDLRGGTLRSLLKKHNVEISLEHRLRWIRAMTATVQVLHERHIIHGDIKTVNMMLSSPAGDAEIFLIDFAGSGIDGKDELGAPSTRYCWLEWPPCGDIQTDLFALGSMIFEVLTGRQPYAELERVEVIQRHKEGRFADVEGLPFGCGPVARKCWERRYVSAKDILADLPQEP